MLVSKRFLLYPELEFAKILITKGLAASNALACLYPSLMGCRYSGNAWVGCLFGCGRLAMP